MIIKNRKSLVLNILFFSEIGDFLSGWRLSENS
jgi:hypothetical protein